MNIQSYTIDRIVFIVKYTPESVFCFMCLDKIMPPNVDFFILLVSNNPSIDVIEFKKIIISIKSKRNIIIEESIIENSQNVLKEHKIQKYLVNLNEFIMKGKILLYLLTSCYSLMKHWENEWEDKIVRIQNFGGRDYINTYSENWEIGFEYTKKMLRYIKADKLIVFEPSYYYQKLEKEHPKNDGDIKNRINLSRNIFPNTFRVINEKYNDSIEAFKMLIDFKRRTMCQSSHTYTTNIEFDFGYIFTTIIAVFGFNTIFTSIKIDGEYYYYRSAKLGDDYETLFSIEKNEKRFDSFDLMISNYLEKIK